MSAATETSAAPASATPKVNDVPEVEGFKVYIGNLAFSATEEQVREHLEKAGGDIVQVSLPTRFKSRRPAGYAFVTYKNEDDAKAVVEKLNDTEIGDRKVQLQLARSKEENAERRASLLEQRKGDKAVKQAAKKEAELASGEGAEKPKKKSKSKANRRRGPEDGDEAAADEGEEGSDAPKSTKSKKTKEPKAAAADGDEAKKAPKERKPRLELTGEESKNTVFVANLPFMIDDDGLSALFTDLSISVKSAHVIKGLRKLPGRRPFRGSKGFGFVELEDESQQSEAVEKVNGMTVGDRKVTARIAQEMKPIEGAEGDEKEEEVKAEEAVKEEATA